MSGILEGIRVVEIGTHIAVPKAARIMADWGAEVVKIEPPGGEAWRTMGKEWNMPYDPDNNPIFQAENANKRSLALNLKAPEGREVLFRLLERADVFISNMRVGSLEKMGLDYHSLKKDFPALVYSHFSAYGETGPDKELPGFDSAAFWANSGTLLEWSKAGQEPFRPFPGFGDSTCGTIILSGILGALLQRMRTGKGDYVRSSLYGSALWMNSLGVIMGQPQYERQYPVEQAGFPNAFAAYYQTRDGDWIVTGSSTWNKHAPGVFKMLGLEKYVDDPSYMVLEETRRHLPEVVRVLQEGYRQISTKDALDGLREIGLVHARLKHPREVSTDEQAWANGYLREVTMGDGNAVVLPTTPVRFESMKEFPYEPGPRLGSDSRRILEELGYDGEEIAALLDSGTVYACGHQ